MLVLKGHNSISLFCFAECSQSHPCQGFGPHAHFRNFGTAMLTLFRIATGDNWNGILEVRKQKKGLRLMSSEITN